MTEWAGCTEEGKGQSKRTAGRKDTHRNAQPKTTSAKPKRERSAKSMKQLVGLLDLGNEVKLHEWFDNRLLRKRHYDSLKVNCLDQRVPTKIDKTGVRKAIPVPWKELIGMAIRRAEALGTGRYDDSDDMDDRHDLDHYAYFFKKVLEYNSRLAIGIFWHKDYYHDEKFKILYTVMMSYNELLRKRKESSTVRNIWPGPIISSDDPSVLEPVATTSGQQEAADTTTQLNIGEEE